MQQKVGAKDRIVAAARELFAERGFHRTAMADLAEHAQVSVGTIYRSFASKSEIIRAIIRDDTEGTFEELKADIELVRHGSIGGAAAIENLIAQWVSHRHDALNHEIVAEAHRDPEVAGLITSTAGQFRELFRNLAQLTQPDLPDDELEGVAELLLACLFNMGNRWFTKPGLDDAQTAASVARLILRALKLTD